MRLLKRNLFLFSFLLCMHTSPFHIKEPSKTAVLKCINRERENVARRFIKASVDLVVTVFLSFYLFHSNFFFGHEILYCSYLRLQDIRLEYLLYCVTYSRKQKQNKFYISYLFMRTRASKFNIHYLFMK